MYNYELFSQPSEAASINNGGNNTTTHHHFNTPSIISSSAQDQMMLMQGSTAAMTRTLAKTSTNMMASNPQNFHQKTAQKPGRELMHEFNKTVASSNEAPNKRRRLEGMIFESGKEPGESMYQTLVTRDSGVTPHTGTTASTTFEQQMKMMSIGDLRIRSAA